MAIEMGDLSIKDGGSFHTYVSLPEGNAKQNMHNLSGKS
jgi:hypothetical protein